MANVAELWLRGRTECGGSGGAFRFGTKVPELQRRRRLRQRCRGRRERQKI